MTQDQALMIVRNPDAYDRAKVYEAAIYLLSLIGTTPEGVEQVVLLLATLTE